MKNRWKRLMAGSLALVLAAGLALPALGAGLSEGDEQSSLLQVTTGTYSPNLTVQAGERYTLIALPADHAPENLTAGDLIGLSGQALFIGSTVADTLGKLTFEDVRLRTAEAAAYYVTGPGLDTPFREVTSTSTFVYGTVTTASVDSSTDITLVDHETDYRYNSLFRAGSDGIYDTGNISPGTYKFRVEKPGYLPYLSNDELIESGKTTIKNFNISANVGDVTNDGARDMADLAALLMYYGGSAPEGITADLDYSGAVDATDAALLCAHLTTGTALEVTRAAASVLDSGEAETAPLRHLSFTVDTDATVSGAAFSLTFQRGAVQPLTPQGGLMSPVDGSALASCLEVSEGYTAQLISWQVTSDQATLSFAVTADTPHATGEIARFYYRPVDRTTASFYRGIFDLPHAAALVGKDTVIAQSELTYPNSYEILLDSISIDQKPAAGESDVTLTIPATGRTAFLPLTVTGHGPEGDKVSNLQGARWSLEGDPTGVSVGQSLLTVTSAAQVGEVTVHARFRSKENDLSDELTVKLEKEPPTPASVEILKNNTSCNRDVLTFVAEEDPDVVYTAQVYDQYGKVMDGEAAVTWSLSGAPAGLSVKDGALVVDDWYKLPAGDHFFTLCAQTEGGIQATVAVELTVEVKVGALTITGPASAVVPEPGGDPLALTYVVSGLDEQGRPIDVLPFGLPFTIDPSDPDISAGQDPSGDYTVTVLPSLNVNDLAWHYNLQVQCDGVFSDPFELDLLPREGATATRAVIYDGSTPVDDVAQLSVEAGQELSVTYTARLLNEKSELMDGKVGEWQWALDLGAPITDLDYEGNALTLTFSKDLEVGSYPFTLTFQEKETGLSASARVVLTVKPVLTRLELTAPQFLTIPADGKTRSYTLPPAAFDASDNSMALPDDVTWSVSQKGATAAPEGVGVSKGVFTVTSTARPGDITVTASRTVGGKTVSASADITLKPAGQGRVLTLYRTITVDGKTVQASGPVPADGDAINIREGQTATVTYTAMLVDQATGEAEAVKDTENITWRGGQSTFTVPANTLSGVYTSNLAADYNGQWAPGAAAQVTVYPNITDLWVDFGPGTYDEANRTYTLDVPTTAPKTYVGTICATILRGGKRYQYPIHSLGLTETDYDIDITILYTGVYGTLDKAAGTLSCQVDPTATQNSMEEPKDEEIRILGLDLSYSPFPSEKPLEIVYPFFLRKEELKPQTAYLRRGVGAGSDFAFDSPGSVDQIEISAGTLSNCYALELRDQYNRPLVSTQDVKWDLTVTPSANKNISIVEPSAMMESAYPNYSSIRRLRVGKDTPAGDYTLELKVTCGAFVRTLEIDLTVTEEETEDYTISLSEGGALTIPRYYYQYNSTEVNKGVNLYPFALTMRTAQGFEMDPSGYVITWSIPGSHTGVSISKTSDSTAEVRADRSAQLTGSTPLQVTATVKDLKGETVEVLTQPLEMVRGASVPTLLFVQKSGSNITRDTITVTSGGSASRDYTFKLWDQYAQEATQSDQQQVKWYLDNVSGSGASATVYRDRNNVPFIRVTVSDPTKSTTVSLTAAITFADASSSTGTVQVFATVPISISVGNNNNGGGSMGGNDNDNDLNNNTAGAPASLTISGGTAQTLAATQGTAATKTFTATLKDAKGQTCSNSYYSKITWSATGLNGGITFNAATHVLTVPATTPAGTYAITITAIYNSSATIRHSVTVTVTVSPKKEDTSSSATDVTLSPGVTQTGTYGTAALSSAQEQALLAASVGTGGTVTIVPTGGNGLTSLSVSLTASTATTLASQRGQTLRIQTSLGTVVLSPEALRALAARGGSNVTVTLTASSGGLDVDFSCGTSAASLPGVIILNAYTPGNVASKVSSNGSATLLKKALVQDGKIYTYLTGSTQLKLETRSPAFTDTVGHWAQSSIQFTAARELFQGTTATTFDPNGNMTRSMIVTVLHRLEDLPTAAKAASFADIASGSWYANAVAWANAEGIVQGTGTGFQPNDPVTREQLAAILHRYVESLDLSIGTKGTLSTFSDQGKVSAWAKEHLEWAVGTGLIQGRTDGTLNPTGYATRAEVSTILERLVRAMAPVV